MRVREVTTLSQLARTSAVSDKMKTILEDYQSALLDQFYPRHPEFGFEKLSH